MPLDPQAEAILTAMSAVPEIPLDDEHLAEVRTGFAGLLLLAGEPEAVFAVETRDADGVPVRIYRPSPDPDLPVVVYYHGGGWTIGTAEQFDAILRQVANASEAIVVAPDYRLAPEHPFPAPLDDCWNALNWTAKHAPSFGGDPTRLAVMGDSAGGNIAAVCEILARDFDGPELALQVLVYPVTDCEFTTASYRDNGEGRLLDTKQMRWFFDCYTRGGVDPADWRISPLRADDVSGVAQALVITAGYDPLRDEGEAYAAKLDEAGVAVEHYRYDGMIHAFFGLSAAFGASRDAIERSAKVIRQTFGTLPS